MNKKLIIFDLDGTLLNTIADLAASTNYSLNELGYPQHPESAYNMFVGNGIGKLLERALPESARTPEILAKIKKMFLKHYDENNINLSTVYKGIPSLLQTLQNEGYILAVASNKYQKATEKLIKHFFSEIKFAAVFGQRDEVPVKPDPMVVNDIITITGIYNKREILYIGDSGVDMQTAINADVDSCGVTWGFRSREELLSFSPDFIVDKPDEILSVLSK